MNLEKIISFYLQHKIFHWDLSFPYTWSSGIQAPFYCDHRRLISHPEIRNLIVNSLCEKFKNELAQAQTIIGTATAGIPWGAWMADKLNLPFAYVRSEKKAHGKGKMIEGDLEKNSRAIIIEDLVSTGKSSINVAHALRDEQIQIASVVSIFSYEMPIKHQAFMNNKLTHHYLLSAYDILNFVSRTSPAQLSQENKILLEHWLQNS